MKKAVIGLFAVILAGCQTPSESSEFLGMEVFQDIPAPKSARVQTDEAASFSYHSDWHRCARYVYRYVGDAREAVEFFETTMTRPPYSWKLEKIEELPAGHDRMSFLQGGRRPHRRHPHHRGRGRGG